MPNDSVVAETIDGTAIELNGLGSYKKEDTSWLPESQQNINLMPQKESDGEEWFGCHFLIKVYQNIIFLEYVIFNLIIMYSTGIRKVDTLCGPFGGRIQVKHRFYCPLEAFVIAGIPDFCHVLLFVNRLPDNNSRK